MRSLTPHRLRRRRLPKGVRRLALWAGVPLVLAGGLYGAVALDRSAFGEWAMARAEDGLVEGSGALGLVVTDIHIEGRSTTTQATVLAALAAVPGTPILAVSPSRAKAQLESLPWVRSAVIERRLPGTLYVRLVERTPIAIWQHDGKQQLIDREGTVIPVRDLSPFAQLPTVVGDDAAPLAADFLAMLATQPDLAARVTAAIRIGARRWNVRIDGAIDVLLPENDPGAAWTKLARLDTASAVLKRDVRSIDLRLPDRIVVRAIAEPPKAPAPAKKGRPVAKST